MSTPSCPRCLTLIRANANFCARCGLRVSAHVPNHIASGAGDWWGEVMATGMRPVRRPPALYAEWARARSRRRSHPVARAVRTAAFFILGLVIAALGVVLLSDLSAAHRPASLRPEWNRPAVKWPTREENSRPRYYSRRPIVSEER